MRGSIEERDGHIYCESAQNAPVGIAIRGFHQMKFLQLSPRELLPHLKKSFLKVNYKQFLMQ